jgi:hypothetical protein
MHLSDSEWSLSVGERVAIGHERFTTNIGRHRTNENSELTANGAQQHVYATLWFNR